MAAGEPETKKLKLDERDDPIFDQFRSDKSKMQLLEYALLVLSKGADSDLKLCMKKIVCEDANADVSFSSATVRTENYTTVGSMPTCGIATGIIFTDGVIILNSFFRYGLLPKNETVKMLLAKLLKFLSKSGEYVAVFGEFRVRLCFTRFPNNWLIYFWLTFQVVSAQSRFGPELFRPWIDSAWVVLANFSGSFWPDVFEVPVG